MKPRLKKYLLYISIAIVGGILLFVLVQTVRANNTGFEVKTLWDWMELLIIPLFLAGGAFYLNRSERESERQRAEERSKLEREIATDRQQESVMQAYLDRMADLLLREKLRTTKKAEVRDVARIQTLTVLRGLDSNRKGLVIKFLQEANLLNKEKAIINLTTADLSKANLKQANLEGVNFRLANLQGANLEGSRLRDANLERAWLKDASLENAILEGANLGGAFLLGANLKDAILSDAELGGANLGSAFLLGAGLRHANLKDANLQDAILEGADISDEQLAIVYSLKGATLQDGTKHD